MMSVKSLACLLCRHVGSAQAFMFPANVSSSDATRMRMPCTSAGTDRPGNSREKSSFESWTETAERPFRFTDQSNPRPRVAYLPWEHGRRSPDGSGPGDGAIWSDRSVGFGPVSPPEVFGHELLVSREAVAEVRLTGLCFFFPNAAAW